MKIIRLIWLVALLGNVMLLKAQNSQEDPYKVIFELQNEVTEQNERIENLKSDLEEMTNNKKKADSLLSVEQTQGQLKQLTDIIDSLEKENVQLRKNLRDSMDLAKQSAMDQLNKTSVAILRLQNQHKKDSATFANLQQELENLRNFKKLWITQLAESVDEKWLDKPYSKIDIAELEKAVEQYKEFAPSDDRVADALKKLNALLGDCRIYNQATHLVNSPYDKTAIAEVAAPLKQLLGKTTDSAKKAELEVVHSQINNYGNYVLLFQDLIKAVEKETVGMDNHKATIPLVRVVIKQKNNDIQKINEVPWLKGQLEKYQEALEKDCLKENEYRKTIMSIEL